MNLLVLLISWRVALKINRVSNSVRVITVKWMRYGGKDGCTGGVCYNSKASELLVCAGCRA